MYFVTTFTKLEKTINERWKLGSQRTIGYFSSLEAARNAVTSNACDLCETIYEYAMIEGIEEGLYPMPFLTELYRVKDMTVHNDGIEVYNAELTYEQMEIPDDLAILSVAIG